MPSFRTATIVEQLASRAGFVRVRLDDGSPAFALTQLTGPVEVGDEVVVNTTAVELGLGSGGWHIVHANLTRPTWSAPGAGHLMKLRYTSLQVDTVAGEEQGPVPASLEGTPIVVGAVHSQLAAIAAGIAWARPGTRTGYVMTDGAALPLAMSDLVAALVDRDLLCGTVTAGHAFGGDLEAINVPAAMALARHRLEAEIVVVVMGPGIAGAGSSLGFTGLEAAPVLDAAAWLGGVPIVSLRCSEADPRERHRGISHHARTVLDAVRSEVLVAAPPGVERCTDRHEWHTIDVGDPVELLERYDLQPTTMGRSVADDRLFFAAAAAAGALAAEQPSLQPREGV